jgi:hypothetical protein
MKTLTGPGGCFTTFAISDFAPLAISTFGLITQSSELCRIGKKLDPYEKALDTTADKFFRR